MRCHCMTVVCTDNPIVYCIAFGKSVLLRLWRTLYETDTMATEAEIEAERLLNNVKREVKQIMEEAVTKKFIYEESNCILALCSK